MDTFGALADPTRRGILELLGRREHTAGEIAKRFEISAPAISQHLKVLREARLVRVRARAQHRVYSLDPAGWSDIDTWLDDIRQFWSTRLDVLARQLKNSPAKKKRRRKR